VLIIQTFQYAGADRNLANANVELVEAQEAGQR
jgi:hypothetical protein